MTELGLVANPMNGPTIPVAKASRREINKKSPMSMNSFLRSPWRTYRNLEINWTMSGILLLADLYKIETSEEDSSAENVPKIEPPEGYALYSPGMVPHVVERQAHSNGRLAFSDRGSMFSQQRHGFSFTRAGSYLIFKNN